MRIKRYLSLFLVALVSVFALGLSRQDVRASEIEYSQDFSSIEPAGNYDNNSTIYGDSDSTFKLNSIRTDQKLNGKMALAGKTNASLVATFPNGVSTLRFNYGRVNFSNDTNGDLKVYIDNVLVETFNYSDTIVSEGNLIINKSSEVVVRFVVSNRSIGFGNIRWNEQSPNLTATVNQLFGPSNETTVPNITAEYGQDVVVPVTEPGNNEFQFALVNGVIRNDFIVGDNTLPITEGLDVLLVYATENNHAVLFLDSNGKLLSNTWVNDNEDVTEPEIANLSKPGYKLSETPWLSNEGHTSLENINSSRVYRLQYELEETNIVKIKVGETTTEHNYNEIVTLTATNENFKAWVDEEGKVLSTNETFKFTALVDRTIKESTNEPINLPVVTLSDDLMLRDDMQTFLGQVELRDGDTLVEHGLIVSEDLELSLEDLTLENGTKARSNVLVPETNEFMLSIELDYVVVRAFATVRDAGGTLTTFYSENQYNDVSFVMLAQGDLTIDSIATIDGLDLPLSGLHNTTITWVSNNPAVITNDGDVTLPEEEINVTMTATIKFGNVELTKEFEVTVRPEGQEPEPEIFTAIIKAPQGSSSGAIQEVTESDMNLDGSIFTVVFTNNSSKNGFYIGNPLRFYAGTKHVITIDDNYIITSITIGTVTQSGNNANLIIGSESTKITSGLSKTNLNTNSFTIDTIAQTRITEITITYVLK